MKRASKARAPGLPAQRRSAETGEMEAVVQDRYGALDVVRLERIPRPDTGEQEVLVQVHAAGLDRGTWHLMTGKPYLMPTPTPGLSAGTEVTWLDARFPISATPETSRESLVLAANNMPGPTGR